ncbi:hypothetical protein GCM10011507_10780 [Edaphobacter acidisoli]|uniref:MucB/RseB N-terminal domain-containing protein n=1 Tax=Edaphobacter acidisoli TaxID=2040573 RepID=A0A916W2K4_9BACT|nr:hypothetical protein GCM10011507_10780 [Edaphobacter acidisoli]
MQVRWFAAALAAAWCVASYGASRQTTAISQPDAAMLAVPPRSWVVEAVNNELVALHHPNSYMRYRMHIVDERRDMTRDVIESQEGTVARMILRNGQPLTADEDKAELQRLNDMMAHPSEFTKHIKDESTGRKLADDLLRLMPDAMIYTYTPGQPQAAGFAGPQIVLDYAPNPKFRPPTITAEALTGLRGRAWIDVKTKHVVRMEGTIFRPVNLGWGLVAHIYPGGTLLLEQADAGRGRWVFTHFTENVSVRALMVKTVNVHAQIDTSDFQILPGPMTYQDAIKILLNTPLPVK